MGFAFDIDRAIEMTTGAMLRELGDEVDLIFRYGSLVRGNINKYSDLDISYVPRNESTWNSITVLVDDIMVDLYAIQWSALEKMARFENVYNTILHDSKVIYQRDEEAFSRFQALRHELRRNQQQEARPAMLRTARELFQQTGYPYFLLCQEVERGHKLATLQQAQAILATILHILAVVNQVTMDTRKLDQVYALPKLPVGLAGFISRIMGTTDPVEILQGTEALMAATRDLLLVEQADVRQPRRPLSETLDAAYPELKGDIQHLILACERQDPYNFNFISLHHELMIHMAWALDGVDYSDFNSIADYEQDLAVLGFPELLPYLEARNYAGLAEQCRAFDLRLKEFLTENGVPLNSFASLDELQVYLDGRPPQGAI